MYVLPVFSRYLRLVKWKLIDACHLNDDYTYENSDGYGDGYGYVYGDAADDDDAFK